jgi:methyl-accepting chemotaxis protein
VGAYGLIIIRASSNITVDSIKPVEEYSHYEFEKSSLTTFVQGSEYIVVIKGTIQSKREEAPGGFICEPALLNITVKNTSSNSSESRLVLLTVCSSNFQYIYDTMSNINNTTSQINNNIVYLNKTVLSINDNLANVLTYVNWSLGNLTLINNTMSSIKESIANLSKSTDTKSMSELINNSIRSINESINNVREIITAPRLIEAAALGLSIVSIGLLSILLIMFKKTMREEIVFGL